MGVDQDKSGEIVHLEATPVTMDPTYMKQPEHPDGILEKGGKGQECPRDFKRDLIKKIKKILLLLGGDW
jgi:hypothetical protein